MLALWVPVTLHCALERLPGLPWFRCCCADDARDPNPAGCDRPLCSTLEAGLVKLEERQTPCLPPLLLALPIPGGTPAEPCGPPPCVVRPDSAPPDLTPRWRFTHRTARTPRAPSRAG